MSYKFDVNKRVENIIKNCIKKLKEFNIKISESIYFYENEGYSYYGTCTNNKFTNVKNDFDITINKYLVYDEDIKETVIHELLHTIEGCNDHKGLWKENAILVNEKMGLNILVSNKYELDKKAYINRKAYNLDEYDSNDMIIVECPICHEKIALKKNKLIADDGSTGYWCKKCHKPYYYNLDKKKINDCDTIIKEMLEGDKIVEDNMLISILPYIEKEICDELLIYYVKNRIEVFIKQPKKIIAANLKKFSTKEGKHYIAQMYINGELDELLSENEKEQNMFSSIFTLTNDYVKVRNHYKNRIKKRL